MKLQIMRPHDLASWSKIYTGYNTRYKN